MRAFVDILSRVFAPVGAAIIDIWRKMGEGIRWVASQLRWLAQQFRNVANTINSFTSGASNAIAGLINSISNLGKIAFGGSVFPEMLWWIQQVKRELQDFGLPQPHIRTVNVTVHIGTVRSEVDVRELIDMIDRELSRRVL